MINPISFTEDVISDFLKYQLSTYKFADENLHRQMRSLLNLESTRQSPLLKGPYVSLSRVFQQGAALDQLAAKRVLHPGIATISSYPRLYAHQEEAIRAIHEKMHTVVSTGTGSGKTECFLYPIISSCLRLRDEGAAPGVSAVIVYPMNALAEDQRIRLRELLVGTGISFGMYTGNTPEEPPPQSHRLPAGTNRDAYRAALARARSRDPEAIIYPDEERVSRKEIRNPDTVPRILLTNIKQLELLLTRGKDASIFTNARLDFLVFDEAHTFTGANGAETAALIRRLRKYCQKSSDDTICIATSATVADSKGSPAPAKSFASRFFGVSPEKVALVTEKYEEKNDLFAEQPQESRSPTDPAVLFSNVLSALKVFDRNPDDHNARKLLQESCQPLFPDTIEFTDSWQNELYRVLLTLKIPFLLSEEIHFPISLQDLQSRLTSVLDREISEEEILTWLALGSAARLDERPLFRPVVHNFVRGIVGAEVTLHKNSIPRLYLSGEERLKSESDKHAFPVLTCTTCGQHYFEHRVQDLIPDNDGFKGGIQDSSGHYWNTAIEPDGTAIFLFDTILGEDEEVYESDTVEIQGAGQKKIKAGSQHLYCCVYCGCLSESEPDICPGCSRSNGAVLVRAVIQNPSYPGRFNRCLSCGSTGNSLTGRYRPPVRAIKAHSAPDIHILAQSMIQKLDRHRLLVFTDNRQDAAFQAGWMRDHARRYRLLNIIQSHLKQHGKQKLGDLAFLIDRFFDENRKLSVALLREVWEYAPLNSAPQQHRSERLKYIQIQLLREITRKPKDSQGLETWGRMSIEYIGIDPESERIKTMALMCDISNESMAQHVAAFLDIMRRNKHSIYDERTQLFNVKWEKSAQIIMNGYYPNLDLPPVVYKLSRENQRSGYVTTLTSDKGQTLFRQVAGKWGCPTDHFHDFAQLFWEYLVEEIRILVSKPVIYNSGQLINPTSGGYQIDSSRILISPESRITRCPVCKQIHSHATAGDPCLAWNCSGVLETFSYDQDDYNIMMLDREAAVLQPAEHSAQVPAGRRESLERDFKDESKEYPNALVCTPTLEMGVDIGGLDCVLMRNVPPLPANYWQRAGRAGRRHRIAVDITYARPASFDQAYFKDPIKLLTGIIDPPSFNLKNHILIRKHIHSAVIGYLRKLEETDREVEQALVHAFPTFTGSYVYDNDIIRRDLIDFIPLRTVIKNNRTVLIQEIQETFMTTWPEEDKEWVSEDFIVNTIDKMADNLKEAVERLFHRVWWCQREMARLSDIQSKTGTLDASDKAIRYRLESFLKSLSASAKNKIDYKSEYAEEMYTLGFLSLEGFLPGYGMDTGTLIGEYSSDAMGADIRAFSIRRTPSVALREFIPGNLLYAMGKKYIPRRIQLTDKPPLVFTYDDEAGRLISESTVDLHEFATISSTDVISLQMGNAEIQPQSTISDEEDYRFSMFSQILGMDLSQHEGGKCYKTGSIEIHHLKNMKFRLVNLGPLSKAENDDSDGLGFPVCPVCGYSTSPFSSKSEKQSFWERHEEKCQINAKRQYAFHVEDMADTLWFRGFEDHDSAFSLVESLRQGASRAIDMTPEDLQILSIPSEAGISIMLYDPMPGGSGLLDQIIEKWDIVTALSKGFLENCPSQCERACIDCLYTYRNSYYHRFLDRHAAIQQLDQDGSNLQIIFSHDIPAKLPQASKTGQPVNNPEMYLKKLIMCAGLPEPEAQKEILLGPGFGKTIPDFYYDGNEHFEGICIYLDGMSSEIHGNPVQSGHDNRLRSELEQQDYKVIVITYSELREKDSMVDKIAQIAKALQGRTKSKAIQENTDWFVDAEE